MLLDYVNKIIKEHKNGCLTFLFTLVFGVIAHMYAFNNKFFNYFEMGNLFSAMPLTQPDCLMNGRWFLPVVTNFFTEYSIPSFTTMQCIIYLTITAMIAIDILKIKELLFRLIFCGAFVTFTGFSTIISFGMNADAFCISIMMGALAAYVFLKFKYGLIPGSIILCLTLGIYQPYMSITIGILFMSFFVDALYGDVVVKDFIKKIIRCLIMLVIGFASYYIILNILLNYTGIQLSDYHGIDSMASFSIKGLIKGFVYSYIYFFQYFFTTKYVYSVTRLIPIIIAALVFLIILVRVVYLKWKQNKKMDVVIFLGVLFFLPLGVNASPFLMADRVGAGVDIYMLYSLPFLWAIYAMLLEHMELNAIFTNRKRAFVLQSIGVFMGVIVIISGYVINNQAYHRMEAMTSNIASMLERIISRVEIMPEWNKEVPVYFANCGKIINDNYDLSIPAYDAMDLLPGTELTDNYNERGIRNYLQVYLHFPIVLPTDEVRESILKSDVYAEMPIFPAKESIAYIDGAIVVKMNE